MYLFFLLTEWVGQGWSEHDILPYPVHGNTRILQWLHWLQDSRNSRQCSPPIPAQKTLMQDHRLCTWSGGKYPVKVLVIRAGRCRVARLVVASLEVEGLRCLTPVHLIPISTRLFKMFSYECRFWVHRLKSCSLHDSHHRLTRTLMCSTGLLAICWVGILYRYLADPDWAMQQMEQATCNEGLNANRCT